MNTAECIASEEEIARRAYERWQERGSPPGDGSDDWIAAERELVAKRYHRNGKTGRGLLSWWRRVRERSES